MKVDTSFISDPSLTDSLFASDCVDDHSSRFWHWSSRVPFSAHLRNRAVAPLLKSGSAKYDRVVFIDDVLFCAEDIAMLLLHQGTHMVSALVIGKKIKNSASGSQFPLKLAIADTSS
eukprot:c14850_g1_i1.p2 GENE.c14850_g1_i1~~c14850_g1_i1.p2  ORF type:complete len:117 (-),score=22.89 c14850_g1_i1:881-1231(-)